MSEETRHEEILRAAYDVAARKGLEALTLRAVAARAHVSHGTVLFHFKSRDDLVSGLLDRVLYAAAVLRVPYAVERIIRPSERLHALLRAEMDRLATEARHFRLFLEYWALGVRSAPIRKKIGAALDAYRAGWKALALPVLDPEQESRSTRNGQSEAKRLTADGIAAVAVSLVQGCALQAVIDPKGLNIDHHFDVAAQMLANVTGRSNAIPNHPPAARNSKRRLQVR